MTFRCVVHGSFRKHLPEIRQAIEVFESAGIEVLAPALPDVTTEIDGFVRFEGEEKKDARLIELLYLRQLKRLGQEGFSYFVDPEGYIGKTTSYELGIAQVTNVPCFFSTRPTDHPVYVHKNSVLSPEDLSAYILKTGALPRSRVSKNDKLIHRMWEDLMVPGSVVATGGIIEHRAVRGGRPELLFVKTHKWGGRYSMIGGKARRHETLIDAVKREIHEETGLRSKPTSHLCTFDQIKRSGYYLSGIQHIFVDYVVEVASKRVRLNDEAEDHVWVAPQDAVHLDLEPNARHTLELYLKTQTT